MNIKNGEIKEDFLQFIPKRISIYSQYMSGQGCVDVATMSGNFNGVQSIIRKHHPAALYIHCSAHSLNLALTHSSKMHRVCKYTETIKSIENIMKISARRAELLKSKIKEFIPETK